MAGMNIICKTVEKQVKLHIPLQVGANIDPVARMEYALDGFTCACGFTLML
jgi:hypothetical protein